MHLDLPCMEIIGVSGLYSDIELLKKPRLVMQLHAMHAQPDLLNVMLLSAICIGHPSASGGSERKGEEVVSIPSSQPCPYPLGLLLCFASLSRRATYHHCRHNNTHTGSLSSSPPF